MFSSLRHSRGSRERKQTEMIGKASLAAQLHMVGVLALPLAWLGLAWLAEVEDKVQESTRIGDEVEE